MSVKTASRCCPRCGEATRIDWPLCDHCAASLPPYRPLPDLRLVGELQRWERANPQPRGAIGGIFAGIKWLWIGVVAALVADVVLGSPIGPINSAWDTLVVISVALAIAGTVVGFALASLLVEVDPVAAWHEERRHVAHQLGVPIKARDDTTTG